MERHAKRLITLIIVSLILIGLAVYAYSQSKEYLAGPSIQIIEPLNGATLNEQVVIIRGIAKNISFISLNDAQIFVNDKGEFKEKLLLNNGYNIMKLSAKDRFGRAVEKKLELIYKL